MRLKSRSLMNLLALFPRLRETLPYLAYGSS
jgi:hypothetical protein